MSLGPSLPSSLVDWLVMLGVTAAIAVAVGLGVLLDARRVQAYRRYCRERGFRFASLGEGEEKRHLATCPLFDLGFDRMWGLTVIGVHDHLPFTAFQYEWSTQHIFGTGSKTHRIACVLWTLPRELPSFVLTPQGLWKWLAIPLAGPRIPFDPFEKFARRYWLQGVDENAVRKLFGPDIRGFLAMHPNQCVSGAGRELMWWRPGRFPGPPALEAFLADGERIRRLFASA